MLVPGYDLASPSLCYGNSRDDQVAAPLTKTLPFLAGVITKKAKL